MAKYFFFWQNISKRPNLDDLAFKKPNGNNGVKGVLRDWAREKAVLKPLLSQPRHTHP